MAVRSWRSGTNLGYPENSVETASFGVRANRERARERERAIWAELEERLNAIVNPVNDSPERQAAMRILDEAHARDQRIINCLDGLVASIDEAESEIEADYQAKTIGGESNP